MSAATRFGPAGEGSGVIVREDGVIVTNHHVIDGADPGDRALLTVVGDDSERSVTIEFGVRPTP